MFMTFVAVATSKIRRLETRLWQDTILSESDILSGIQLLAGPWIRLNWRLSAWAIKDLPLAVLNCRSFNPASFKLQGLCVRCWMAEGRPDRRFIVHHTILKLNSLNTASSAQYIICASVMSQRKMLCSFRLTTILLLTFLCHLKRHAANLKITTKCGLFAKRRFGKYFWD